MTENRNEFLQEFCRRWKKERKMSKRGSKRKWKVLKMWMTEPKVRILFTFDNSVSFEFTFLCRGSWNFEKVFPTYGSHTRYGSVSTTTVTATFLGSRSPPRQGLRNPIGIATTNGERQFLTDTLLHFQNSNENKSVNRFQFLSEY